MSGRSLLLVGLDGSSESMAQRVNVQIVSRTARIIIVVCSLALSGAAAAIARADLQDHDLADRIYEKYKKRSDERSERESAPQMRVSLDQATNIVRRRTDGQVIGAKTSRSGNSITHRIKVMKDGKVRTYSVDGVTGKVR